MVVAARRHLVGGGPGQHVDDVALAEALARPKHRGQRHPHRLGGVPDLGRAVANVAVAAGARVLAEIPQQNLPPAAARLGQPEQRVQPRVVGLFPVGGGQPLVDLAAAQADVLGAVERQRLGRGAVAAGAADLLIIGLDRLGQVGVRDPADVGFVDPHAKGDRGRDHQPVLALEPRLGGAAGLGLHPAVIGERGDAGGVQRRLERLGLGAGGAVDDARLPAAGGGEVHDLPARPVLGLEGEVDVRPVEAAQEHLRRRTPEQPGHDLVPGLGVGGGGKRRQRHAQRLPQLAHAQVVGPEVVPPLADAMRLVHGDGGDAGAAQHRHRRPRGEPLGRHVEDLQRPLTQPGEDGVRLGLGVARGQRAGRHPRLAQAAHLVAHQRDEGRDDHGHALAHQRRQLVAERLAAARGHDRQHVAARGHGLDDLLLAGAESVEAPDLAQQVGGHQ